MSYMVVKRPGWGGPHAIVGMGTVAETAKGWLYAAGIIGIALVAMKMTGTKRKNPRRKTPRRKGGSITASMPAFKPHLGDADVRRKMQSKLQRISGDPRLRVRASGQVVKSGRLLTQEQIDQLLLQLF